jgi:hypothetical protein
MQRLQPLRKVWVLEKADIMPEKETGISKTSLMLGC